MRSAIRALSARFQARLQDREGLFASRTATVTLAALSLFLLAVPLTIGKPGQPATLKADEPAYYLMALSLARDFDLSYEPADGDRLLEEFPFASTGNLILMTSDGWRTVHYGKPLAYSLFGAPFAALWGANGLLFFNMALFVAMLWLAALFLARRASPAVAAAFACGLLLLSACSRYVFWLQPEVFNMFGVFGALYWGFENRRHAWWLTALSGVLQVEPTNGIAARLRNGHLQKQTAIQALTADARLQRVVDVDYRAIRLDRPGLVLSTLLAEQLQVEPGDTLMVEIMEDGRPVREVVLTDTVDDLLGVTAYMEQESLRRLVRRDDTISGAMLKIDALAEERLFGLLKAMPAVAGVTLRSAALENIQTYMLDNMSMMMSVNLLFAVIIAFGVIYNTARISLSETSRELASLRVIGFTRGEISSILLGELGILTVASIPLGLLLGYGMIAGVMSAFESELFRLPVVVDPNTFLVSAATVLGSMAVSAWTVRRKLHELDLVAVLKTRE